MAYSRITRKQLVTLDLIQGVIDAQRAAAPSDTQIDQVLRRIDRIAHEIRQKIVYVNRKGGPVFENQKEYNRYKMEVQGIQNAVVDAWPGESIDGREYVNCILTFLDDELTHPESKTKVDWQNMVTELQNLYEMMDPELSNASSMDVGARVAEIMKDAFEKM